MFVVVTFAFNILCFCLLTAINCSFLPILIEYRIRIFLSCLPFFSVSLRNTTKPPTKKIPRNPANVVVVVDDDDDDLDISQNDDDDEWCGILLLFLTD